MKLKPELLEQLINQEIKEVGSSPYCEASSFAIHEDSRVQVQIVITRNTDDFHDELLPEYVAEKYHTC